MTLLTAWERARRSWTNALIALALGLMLVQTWPGVPYWLSWRPRIVADATGLWQAPWGMFTPEPDDENHRLRATIEYHDGRRVEWQSPTWADESHWQRFTGHRRAEYIDNIRTPYYAPALPGMAAWLARTHRTNFEEAGRPRRVEIHAEYYNIPDPRLNGWKVRSLSPAYEHQTQLYAEDYP